MSGSTDSGTRGPRAEKPGAPEDALDTLLTRAGVRIREDERGPVAAAYAAIARSARRLPGALTPDDPPAIDVLRLPPVR